LSSDRSGQTLNKFKNIFYGVYWDQYQGFKTPAFWLNVFFQKAAPPYSTYMLQNANYTYSKVFDSHDPEN
jgi:hypothetical protein